MKSLRLARKGIKYTKKYLIAVMAGIVLLVAVSVFVLKIYDSVYENSIMDKGNIAATDYYLSVYQNLSKEIAAVDVTTENADRMMEDGASADEIEQFLKLQTNIYLNALDSSFEGVYMSYRGEYLDGYHYEMNDDYDASDRPWYQSAVEAGGETTISEPYVDAATEETIFTISKLCGDGESVVAADVDLVNIQEITDGVLEDSPYTVAAVVSKDGLINSCSEEAYIGSYLEDHYAITWEYFEDHIADDVQKSFSFTAKDEGGKSVIFAHRVYGDWYVMLAAKRVSLNHSIYLMHIVALAILLGAIAYLILFLHNVRRTRATRDKFRKLSEMDQMTGLLNRGFGEYSVREQLQKATIGAFFLMDADHFKSINDTFGHTTGDKVLIAVAKALKDSFRTKDIVFRLGGDEFACFAPGVKEDAEINRVCERLLKNIDAIKIPELGERKLSASIGVAVCTEKEDFDQLYHRADSAAYISKKTEGSCFTIAERSGE